MAEELRVKGIILAAAPQGDYGKRITLLCDRLGKVTVFATGAARATSKLIGILRPMTAVEVTMVRGRSSAYTLVSASSMDTFEELLTDVDASFMAMYFLEAAEYFSQEGMAETDSRKMLNFLFVSLSALRDAKLPVLLIQRIFELKLLVLQGEYTTEPFFRQNAACVELWQKVTASSLSSLYKVDTEEIGTEALADFEDSVKHLMNMQVEHKFRSLAVLKDMQ